MMPAGMNVFEEMLAHAPVYLGPSDGQPLYLRGCLCVVTWTEASEE
jgi:hypothetical protein